ncbi:protein arginine kinase [Ethanoligenens harbinense]|uniref:Protein-arginine kinase n=1 Tax=Ethanoligenens harbinense (strain DSM 18485 / JCM 12961 / CGMCC 1.5033 / YUAN-3) TaxID=663278 RepID=E6U6R4_ETHHY|nr:protein arginine kinase [Ethanoligenens harbinense]ADU25797.1 ATP:guanido phosphotransferase [Ethanoligenens harbinense YUAN-3]AVQ94961.1 protein arginine kinase [Ethanoligenens harbinense YUAN-3]AYF37653.1 protein arginine kinase [Ethanoligenens harbinense]AYF40373.1 protein arginine kinase [Ethanoligenens harbinense]QCN91208.1 protein arginine kinase [Ethanoligenens harbinense]
MKWYLETGPEGDAVISTRVRLARNISDMLFPCKMNLEQAHEVEEATRAALFSDEQMARDFEYIDMEKLGPARSVSYAEKHLISPEFAKERAGRALLLKKDESVSIMINEEDHIRIQALASGFRLEDAMETANHIDDLFDRHLQYAFDEDFGYLTECPTNLGTGMRASLMLHLPGLTRSRSLPSLAQAITKLGFTIRGLYGEGSKGTGSFYQISNQVTLGISEAEVLRSLTGVVSQIIAQERSIREEFKKLGPVFEDRIFRSYGILANARMLTSEEFMNLISDVRFGITMDIITDVPLEAVNALLGEVQPATLQTQTNHPMDEQERDILRAKIVRETLTHLGSRENGNA